MKRIIQVSLDVEISESEDGNAVSESISAILEQVGYIIPGASFVEDVTKEYVKSYGFSKEKYKIGENIG